MKYAIIELGGKQIWVESGKFYDVNRLKAIPGQTVYLNKVLFLGNNGEFSFGKPCLENFSIKVKILRHLKSRKTIVFKMKRKKNMRSKRGHRQELTRVLIQSI